jgi:Ni/Co efflux regulator RcnB
MRLHLLWAAIAVSVVTPALALWAEPQWEPYERMAPPQERPPQHHWKIGEHIPKAWDRGHDADWRSHHLSPPPKGNRWMQDGNAYLLTRNSDGKVVRVTTDR